MAIVVAVLFAGNTLVTQALFTRGGDPLLVTYISGSSPALLLILLGSFGLLTLGAALAAWQLQKRRFWSLTGPPREMLAQFWRVLRLLVILGAVIFALPPYSMGTPLQPNLPFSVWVLLLPFALLAVLVQVSAEEILFRGYIQQSLAARFSHPLIWMGLPSILFGLGHFLPEEAGDNAILIVVWSGIFGLLMADLTARAGTLGPAIALHLFNNVLALLFIAFPDNLSGLALYVFPFEMSDTGALRGWLAVDFVMMLCGWLTARIALRR